jgi:hypothetical protein
MLRLCAYLSQVLAWFSICVSPTHCAANAGGYPDSGYNETALPNAAVLHARALLVRRLLPPPASQEKTAFIKCQSKATSLPCKIIFITCSRSQTVK